MLIAASVIAFYQETLEKAVTLAVFLPIISDMSGCSGNQAVAVSIRELILGAVRPRAGRHGPLVCFLRFPKTLSGCGNHCV